MTPLKIKAYLLDRSAVSLQDVVKEFNIDSALAWNLLQFWVKKGLCTERRSCSECQLCDAKIYFQWNEHAKGCF